MKLVRQLLVFDPRTPVDVGRAVFEQRLELTAADDVELQVGGNGIGPAAASPG